MSAKLQVFSRGFCLRKERCLSSSSGGGKRGCLNGSFSSASFRRLREFCIRFGVSGADCWGITFTIPGMELISVSDFRKLQHKLVVWCNDNGLPLIWRVELQQRKMPHLHCVAFSDRDLVFKLVCRWFKWLSSFSCVECFEGDFVIFPRSLLKGASHAVDLQRLSGGFSAFRYLVSHMSKSKQAQLGWVGRNWGVCNKSLFSPDDPCSFDLLDYQYYVILRWLRRLTRGSVRPSSGCSFWVTDPCLISRMYAFIVECERIPSGVENDSRDSRSCRLHWEWSSFCLAFLLSIPQQYFNSVLDSIKQDVSSVLRELLFMSLRWLVYYKDFCL